MAYAIIQLNGKQYKVSPKDEIIVDRVPQAAGEKVTSGDVLLVCDGDKVNVGTPLVSGASVSYTIKDHQRGKKIRVSKYKSKSRYRRVQGHRQEQSVLVIEAIKV
ncbi:MAG: 50S ribosomal protein L21 [Candidatus Pacebacteria bacterium CG_4_10_14_0_8_um_filter_43_12]|nr:MAG: 50S ribosomal protein L21 [Candidatus Pacebacteria bacterium CG10_big_fil_rev_8_21_14_0_10_44_11]PIY78978.1 MAG: 50S ribosomal protein L21 [Candidatus Pacebacteria bacterium CG_4_10_14_0_8_um_filter_43_12]